MKKVLLLIVAIVSVLQASAQDSHSVTIPIDSLTLRLDRLQHDYDYMYCDFELHKLMSDFTVLSHSIDNSSNGVLINVYHSRYNRVLYNAYLDNYNADCENFDSLKEKVESVKGAVLVKIAVSDFSDLELNVLSISFDLIERSITKVERALDYYKTCIDAYRSKI